eukprot:m.1130697 g.1130697  ORF g.1130697 m.1130697 type:complete len:362 (+) comp24423_c2_seq1:1026-2111(+)
MRAHGQPWIVAISLLNRSTTNPFACPVNSRKLTVRRMDWCIFKTIPGNVCGSGPGSFGHYAADARTIAVESRAKFLKIDYCAYYKSNGNSTQPSINTQQYYWAQFRDALNKTGHPLYLYTCPRSFQNGISGSIYDGPPRNWTAKLRTELSNCMLTEYHNAQDTWTSAMSNLDALLDLGIPSAVGPGFWQDADMLQTCNFGKGKTPGTGMTQTEYNATFATWAVLASQMIISADPREVALQHPHCLRLLLNTELLAINQDSGGLPPTLLFHRNNTMAFSRRLHDKSIAVVVLNRNDNGGATAVHVTRQALGISIGAHCRVRDLLQHRTALPAGTPTKRAVPGPIVAVNLVPHEAAALRITCV